MRPYPLLYYSCDILILNGWCLCCLWIADYRVLFYNQFRLIHVPTAAMMSSTALPLTLATYCHSFMPATVQLDGQFDNSLIWLCLSFQPDKLPYLAAKCLFNHLGQHSGRGWDAHLEWQGVQRLVSTRCIPLCKGFCFYSEDEMMIKQRRWFFAVEKKKSFLHICA